MLNSRALIRCFNSNRFFTSSTKATRYNFLIIDGYSKDGRDDLVKNKCSTAGKLYQKMLSKCSLPYKIDSDIIYPTDDNFNINNIDFNKYHGITWTGSSLTAYEDHKPEVKNQLDLCKYIFNLGIPQFGSCWALQICAKVAGATIAKNIKGREMGIGRNIRLTNEGRSHLLYHGKSNIFNVYSSHEDEVTHIPAHIQILSSNNHSYIQALDIQYLNGTAWTIQYHPEYDLLELAYLIQARTNKLIQMNFFQNQQAVLTYSNELIELYNNPNRYDISWKYGIDEYVLDENIRFIEPKNWIKYQVEPYYLTAIS